MQKRMLGRDGFAVTEMGLGCWQLGGGDWGEVAEHEALAILQAAVDGGVTFFDTADVYGAGRSERMIGTFLRGCAGRDAIRVATKFGRGSDVFPDRFTRAAMRESVEGSLERLGVACLDLLQLHCIPEAALADGAVFDWLRELRDDGKIRHFGASVETVTEGLICIRQEGLLSLQVIYNLFRQKLTAELLPQAAAAGVGIIVRLPLASGLLAGKFTTDTTFADSDHRHYNRDGAAFNVGETFAGLPFATGVALADALKPLVPPGLTMAQMTLRWILDHPEVSVVIPGASRPAQATANCAAAHLPPLSAELHAALTRFYADAVHAHIRGPY